MLIMHTKSRLNSSSHNFEIGIGVPEVRKNGAPPSTRSSWVFTSTGALRRRAEVSEVSRERLSAQVLALHLPHVDGLQVSGAVPGTRIQDDCKYCSMEFVAIHNLLNSM